MRAQSKDFDECLLVLDNPTRGKKFSPTIPFDLRSEAKKAGLGEPGTGGKRVFRGSDSRPSISRSLSFRCRAQESMASYVV